MSLSLSLSLWLPDALTLDTFDAAGLNNCALKGLQESKVDGLTSCRGTTDVISNVQVRSRCSSAALQATSLCFVSLRFLSGSSICYHGARGARLHL